MTDSSALPGQPEESDEAYEHAACGLVTTSIDGTIVRANGTFCRWMGYSSSELKMQRRIQDLLNVGGKLFHQTHLAPLLQMQRSVAEVKLILKHKDGSKIPMLVNAARRSEASSALGEVDEFAFMIVHDRDSYEQELLRTRQSAEDALEAKGRADELLRLADRRKDEFLATLAHELRNPLAPIRAVVQLFQQKEFDDPQVLWARDVLERQVAQMVTLVDDILDVSRIAEGKLELRKQCIELSASIHRALEGSRGFLEAASHELVLNLPVAPVYIDADPVRLMQIVQNVLNNAAKYTPAGGRIELSADVEGDEAVIRIEDNGIGIAPEHLPTLFGVFYQLAPGLSRSQGGLGLGLSLVRALTEQHGGTVTAFSAGTGKGSEFVIRLPLSSDTALPASTDDEQRHRPSGAGRRVLIVDDNEDASLSLAMLLDSDGYETRTASDGATGLAIVHTWWPDTVILDIGLPDMTGFALARKIRALPFGQGTLLIAVTGWSQQQDVADSADAGIDHHLSKPLQYDRLLEIFTTGRRLDGKLRGA